FVPGLRGESFFDVLFKFADDPFPGVLLGHRQPTFNAITLGGLYGCAAMRDELVMALRNICDFAKIPHYIRDCRTDDHASSGHILQRLGWVDVLGRFIEREWHQANVESFAKRRKILVSLLPQPVQVWPFRQGVLLHL